MAPEGAKTNTYLRPPGLLVRFALAGALLLAACRQDVFEPDGHYLVPKQAAVVPAAETAAPPPAGGLRWTLPSGWKEEAGGSAMRFATLTPPRAGNAQVTVSRFPGDVGGELANVNRWRGQLGLAPVEQAQLAKERRTVSTAAGPLAVYDFTNEATKKRTVAGFASVEGETWFLKLSGDTEGVAAASPAFHDLLRSLRLEAR